MRWRCCSASRSASGPVAGGGGPASGRRTAKPLAISHACGKKARAYVLKPWSESRITLVSGSHAASNSPSTASSRSYSPATLCLSRPSYSRCESSSRSLKTSHREVPVLAVQQVHHRVAVDPELLVHEGATELLLAAPVPDAGR